MAKNYRIKKAFSGRTKLTAVVDGKRVALVEAYTVEIEGTKIKPPETVNVPLATQTQLKALFERGDPAVEVFEQAEIKNPFEDYEPKNPFDGAIEKREEMEQERKKKKVKNEPE